MKGQGSITKMSDIHILLPSNKEIWYLTKIGPKNLEHIPSQYLTPVTCPLAKIGLQNGVNALMKSQAFSSLSV